MSWREFVFASIGAFMGALLIVLWPLRRERKRLQLCEQGRARCEQNCARLHEIVEEHKRRDVVLADHAQQINDLRNAINSVGPALELLKRAGQSEPS